MGSAQHSNSLPQAIDHGSLDVTGIPFIIITERLDNFIFGEFKLFQ